MMPGYPIPPVIAFSRTIAETYRRHLIACIFIEKRLTRTNNGSSPALGHSEGSSRQPSPELRAVKMFLGLLVAVLVAVGAEAQSAPDSTVAGKAARDAGTILVDKCLSCHGPGTKEGGA